MSDHHAGTIALVGRPNAGKSTLLNHVLGVRLAATSSKPQTTRNRVVGIHTADDLQAVLVDTPGLHRAKSRMNRAMVGAARSAMGEVDLICWVVDAARIAGRRSDRPVLHPGLEQIAELITSAGSRPPVVALNKVDVMRKPDLLPIMAAFHERLPGAELVPVSSLKGSNVDRLVEAWRRGLPAGEALYPAGTVSDQPERFAVGELIREKVFRLTHQEVPYQTAVIIEGWEERAEGEEGRGVVVVFARILVERDSQRGLIIGKGGEKLKQIGTRARADIEALLGTRIHLDLHVSVKRDWTRNPRLLRELGIE